MAIIVLVWSEARQSVKPNAGRSKEDVVTHKSSQKFRKPCCIIISFSRYKGVSWQCFHFKWSCFPLHNEAFASESLPLREKSIKKCLSNMVTKLCPHIRSTVVGITHYNSLCPGQLYNESSCVLATYLGQSGVFFAKYAMSMPGLFFDLHANENPTLHVNHHLPMRSRWKIAKQCFIEILHRFAQIFRELLVSL